MIKRNVCNKYCCKHVGFTDDKPLNLSLRDIINETMCRKQSSSSLPKWDHGLRQYVSCPKYTVPEYESSDIHVDPIISFINTFFFSGCIYGLI